MAVLLQHCTGCSTVAALHRVLLQHAGAIAAPWCYCSTERKKKGTQDQEKSKKGKNLNLVEMAKLRTKRHIPDPRVPGKAPRQELIVVHPVFASGSSGFRSKNYLLFIYEVLSIYLSFFLSFYLSIFLSFYLSIYLSIYLCV